MSPSLVLSEYRVKARIEYLKELSIFVVELLFVFGLVSLIGMRSIFVSSNTLYAFWLATIGYFGLLVGLFHKLILRGENYLNVAVTTIVLLGIALSSIVLWVTNNRLYQLLVSALASWTFALVTGILSHRESAFHRRGFRLSPSLNTSGYQRIGKPSNQFFREKLNRLTERLEGQKGKLRKLVPSSPEVAARILARAAPTSDRPFDILESQAFPDLFEQVSAATTDYRSDKIVVYIVPEKVRREFDDLGVFAIASLIPSQQGSIVQIFAMIPTGCDNPESYILEVVVHEYLECFRGYSHLHSLIAGHALFSESNKLPYVTLLDLQRRPMVDLRRIHCHSEENVSKALNLATKVLGVSQRFDRRILRGLLNP
ncbi:hypothetical protein HDU93_006055, partial [Gonapodya sp. JEL0774]